eukprot:gene4088-14188_t
MPAAAFHSGSVWHSAWLCMGHLYRWSSAVVTQGVLDHCALVYGGRNCADTSWRQSSAPCMPLDPAALTSRLISPSARAAPNRGNVKRLKDITKAMFALTNVEPKRWTEKELEPFYLKADEDK